MVRSLFAKQLIVFLVAFSLVFSPTLIAVADPISVPNAGVKTTVAIMSFTDETSASELQLGSKVADSLAITADQSGYYSVAPRSKTANVLADADSAAKAGKELNVDKVIIGKVSKYQVVDNPREVIIEATAQVVDVTSGKVVGSTLVKGSSGQKFDYKGSNEILINEAVNNLASQMILILKNSLSVEGVVLSTDGTDKVKVDLDKSKGINVGAEFTVLRSGIQIAKLKVEEVKSGFSVAKVVSVEPGQQIQVNDKAKLTFNPAESKEEIKSKGINPILGGLLALGIIALIAGGKKGGSSNPTPPTPTPTSTVDTIEITSSADTVPTEANNVYTYTLTARAYNKTNGTVAPAGTKLKFSTTTSGAAFLNNGVATTDSAGNAQVYLTISKATAAALGTNIQFGATLDGSTTVKASGTVKVPSDSQPPVSTQYNIVVNVPSVSYNINDIVPVSVVVTDKTTGLGVAGVKVNVSTDLGQVTSGSSSAAQTLTDLTTTTGGRIDLTLTSMSGGTATVTATAVKNADGSDISVPLPTAKGSVTFKAPIEIESFVVNDTNMTIGGSTDISVTVRKGGQPASNVPVQFGVKTPAYGATVQPATAVTDATGVATAVLKAGTSAGSTDVWVVVGDNAMGTAQANKTVNFVDEIGYDITDLSVDLPDIAVDGSSVAHVTAKVTGRQTGAKAPDGMTVKFEMITPSSQGMLTGNLEESGNTYGSNLESISSTFGGQAKANITSGTRAGSVKIIATVLDKDGNPAANSTPREGQILNFVAGQPDQNHFSVATDLVNVRGWDYDNERANISIIVGDKYANPVKPGTVIYFTTSGGVIEGTAITNNLGNATAVLMSGNPRPVMANAPINGVSTSRDGVATIMATVPGMINGTPGTVLDYVNVIFSGPLAHYTFNTSATSVPVNGTINLSFTTSDINNNPILGTIAFKVTGVGSVTTPSLVLAGATPGGNSGSVKYVAPKDSKDGSTAIIEAWVTDSKGVQTLIGSTNITVTP